LKTLSRLCRENFNRLLRPFPEVRSDQKNFPENFQPDFPEKFLKKSLKK
jgi:hypothetical protein